MRKSIDKTLSFGKVMLSTSIIEARSHQLHGLKTPTLKFVVILIFHVVKGTRSPVLYRLLKQFFEKRWHC